MRRLIPRLALALLIAAGAGWAALHRHEINLAALDAWLGSLGVWAPIGHVILYAVATVIFVPGVVFTLAGGALFGPVWGSLWNLLGATLGASLAFLSARYIVGDWVERRARGFVKRVVDGVAAEGWRFVALARLVPFVPFNLLNYALGLTRIRFLPYVATTFVCMAPGAVGYTWLGHAGRSLLSRDAATVDYGLLALAFPAAVAFLPRLVGRLRDR